MERTKLTRIANAVFWFAMGLMASSFFFDDRILAGWVFISAMGVVGIWNVLHIIQLKRDRVELRRMLSELNKTPMVFENVPDEPGPDIEIFDIKNNDKTTL